MVVLVAFSSTVLLLGNKRILGRQKADSCGLWSSLIARLGSFIGDAAGSERANKYDVGTGREMGIRPTRQTVVDSFRW